MLFVWSILLIIIIIPVSRGQYTLDWQNVEKALSSGDVAAVHSLQKADILLFLDKIALMPLGSPVKRAVWDVIKSPTNEPASVQADTLLRMGNLLSDIPDLDLYALNVSSWDVVEALGSTLQDRRRLGIVAYATLNVWGPQIVHNEEALLHFRGIICGLTPHVLHKIQPSVLVNISRAVIKYFQGCDPHQYKVILQLLMQPSGFGPPGSWNAADVESMSIAITKLPVKLLRQLRPEAMAGLVPSVMQMFPLKSLMSFNNQQLRHLRHDSISVFYRITGYSSSSAHSYNMPQTEYMLFLFIFIITSIGDIFVTNKILSEWEHGKKQTIQIFDHQCTDTCSANLIVKTLM